MSAMGSVIILPRRFFNAGDLAPIRHLPEAYPAQPKTPHISSFSAAPKTASNNSCFILWLPFRFGDLGLGSHNNLAFYGESEQL